MQLIGLERLPWRSCFGTAADRIPNWAQHRQSVVACFQPDCGCFAPAQTCHGQQLIYQLAAYSWVSRTCSAALARSSTFLERSDVQEDKQLMELISRHGTGNWSVIARELPGRNGKSCRLRCTTCQPSQSSSACSCSPVPEATKPVAISHCWNELCCFQPLLLLYSSALQVVQSAQSTAEA